MRKLLYLFVALIGFGAYGQSNIFATVGHLQGMEFIGDDIKNGMSNSLGVNIDFFGKKNFDFGITTSVHLLGDLKSDIEFLEAEEVLAAGLHIGFQNDSVGLNIAYQLPALDEDPFFKSMVSGKINFKGKGAIGWMFGADYFFNRHLFHYTYSINTGLTIKL